MQLQPRLKTSCTADKKVAWILLQNDCNSKDRNKHLSLPFSIITLLFHLKHCWLLLFQTHSHNIQKARVWISKYFYPPIPLHLNDPHSTELYSPVWQVLWKYMASPIGFIVFQRSHANFELLPITAPFNMKYQIKTKKAQTRSLPIFISLPPSHFSYPCIFFTHRLADCLNPVPNYFAPEQTLFHRHQQHMRASLPLSQTAAWTHVSDAKLSQHRGAHHRTVIVCLCYLCPCTVCSKWHYNAIIHSCHHTLLSIRLMMFCNRPVRLPCSWNQECEK